MPSLPCQQSIRLDRPKRHLFPRRCPTIVSTRSDPERTISMTKHIMTYTRFTLDSSTPSLWRVTFKHPPINLIDSVMIRELGDLFAAVERNEGPAVLVFDSADPDYFLAHCDIAAENRALVDALPAGPTGFHPWVDRLVRLRDRKSTRLNSSHTVISYAVFCLKKKKKH